MVSIVVTVEAKAWQCERAIFSTMKSEARDKRLAIILSPKLKLKTGLLSSNSCVVVIGSPAFARRMRECQEAMGEANFGT